MEIIRITEGSPYFREVIEDETDDLGFEFVSNSSNKTYSLIDNRLLSSISYSISLDEADILYIYTKKDELKKGYGYKLLKESMEILKSDGIREIFLEVRASNIKAYGLYKKCGFFEIGTRKKYYKDGEDAILMKVTL